MTLSIAGLMSVHDELDAMFLEHQRALLRLDRDQALAALDRYETTLKRHMRDEEDVLLPIYSDQCEFPAVGAPKLYLDEHEKMRAHLALLKGATIDLENAADPERAVLRLLGHEAFYLRLCGHHDKREAQYLYPLLDETLTSDEKAGIMARVYRRSEIGQPANA